MSTTIHVRGISPTADLTLLKEMFEKHGVVESLEAKQENSKPPSQSVFVVMPSSEDAQRALTSMSGKDFEGRKLSMRQASLRRIG
jgi:RNA recognition motif-containing protein